jgi:hypothetical protein
MSKIFSRLLFWKRRQSANLAEKTAPNVLVKKPAPPKKARATSIRTQLLRLVAVPICGLIGVGLHVLQGSGTGAR